MNVQYCVRLRVAKTSQLMRDMRPVALRQKTGEHGVFLHTFSRKVVMLVRLKNALLLRTASA